MILVALTQFINKSYNTLLTWLRHIEGLGPLSLRLYLAPVLIAAGLHKLHNIDDIISWFGNTEWGLGLPAPALMAYLAALTETIGGFALIAGLATRLVAIPLMVAMAVAAFSVHWEHGWFAIASSNPDTSTAVVMAKIGVPGAQESLANSLEVGRRLTAAKELLREHGNYSWLTGRGGFVVLNNGIEFAATYFIMCFVLLFTGGGRYFSVDYWIRRKFGNMP